jgi:hypothetical protein
MMRLYGHTNAFMPPRPGFPGDPEKDARMLEAQKNLQQKLLGDGLGSMQANSPQLAQMQGMLQGAPIGGIPRQVPQPPPPQQQPTRRGGFFGGRGTAPVTPPSFASQMRGMGLAGIPNPTLPEPTGMSPTQSQAVQAVVNKMQGAKLGGFTGMKKGGAVKKKASSKTYKSGGSVSSASKRADGCAIKGKTKGKIV